MSGIWRHSSSSPLPVWTLKLCQLRSSWDTPCCYPCFSWSCMHHWGIFWLWPIFFHSKTNILGLLIPQWWSLFCVSKTLNTHTHIHTHLWPSLYCMIFEFYLCKSLIDHISWVADRTSWGGTGVANMCTLGGNNPFIFFAWYTGVEDVYWTAHC